MTVCVRTREMKEGEEGCEEEGTVCGLSKKKEKKNDSERARVDLNCVGNKTRRLKLSSKSDKGS